MDRGDREEQYEPEVPASEVRKREEKWLKMLANWDKFIEKEPKKLVECCRKGVPASLRGNVWLKLSGADRLMAENQGVFAMLATKPDNEHTRAIDCDLARTFPTCVLFAKKGAQGQSDLRMVLKAYEERSGYYSAMTPIAATLLVHMPAEEAFWCLVQICEQYLPGYYSPEQHAFHTDAMILKDLLARYIPETNAFMDSMADRLDPIMYCTEWLLCIYSTSRTLPWPMVLRVWDMFFLEGIKVLFKVAVALCHLAFLSKESHKECRELGDLIQRLHNLPLEVAHEGILMPEILKYHLTSKELQNEQMIHGGHFTADIEARRYFNRRDPLTPSETNKH